MKFSSILLTFFMLFGLTTAVVAQDSLTASIPYLGVLYTGSYDGDGAITHFSSVRLGGKVLAPAIFGTEFQAEAGYDLSPTKSISFGKFVLRGTTPAGMVSVGWVTRPIAIYMRPTPISAGGHFEPPSLAAMPGSGLGTTLAGTIGGMAFQAGPYWIPTTKSVEWNAGAKWDAGFFEMRIAGFVGKLRKGFATSFIRKEATLTTFVDSDRNVTGFFEYRAPWFSPYITGNTDGTFENWKHLEIGWTKLYQGPNGVKALLGMGWQYHTKLVNAYVQIYL